MSLFAATINRLPNCQGTVELGSFSTMQNYFHNAQEVKNLKFDDDIKFFVFNIAVHHDEKVVLKGIEDAGMKVLYNNKKEGVHTNHWRMILATWK